MNPRLPSFRSLLAIVLLAVLVLGCGPATKLTKEDRARIQTVAQPISATLPAAVTYQGPSHSFGMAIGGAIGALIAMSGDDAIPVITKFMGDNDVRVDEMVTADFNAALREAAVFPNIVDPSSEGVEARFDLDVLMYGMVKGWGFSTVAPAIQVQGSLVDAQGETLWTHVALIGAGQGELPDYTYEEWLTDGDRFRDAFEQASEQVVDLLIKDLMSDPPPDS